MLSMKQINNNTQTVKLSVNFLGQKGREGGRLRLAVPLYGRHLRKWPNRGTESKTSKKSERKCRGFPRQLSMRICVQSVHNDSDWSVSKTQSSRRAAYRASSRNALCRAAWIPPHWSVVERDSAHVYYRASWELFVGAPSRGPCEHSEDCYGISLLQPPTAISGFAAPFVPPSTE